MWFSRKKEKRDSPMMDATARFISSGIISTQTKIVLRLQAWESRCSLWQKKLLFALFCVITTVALISILFGALTSKDPAMIKSVTPVRGIQPSTQPPLLLPFKDSIRVPR